MTQSDGKQISLAATALGLVMSAAGVFGVWVQGDVWGDLGGMIRGNLNVSELYLILGLPAGVTAAGALLVSWAILGSPVAGTWTARRRNATFAAYAAVLISAIGGAAVLGGQHLWAVEGR
ncbi:MAG: hypothetical protein GX595_04795 [Lentisphaerae bacterium]|nr:hypothetical protein [Lentisphaerota bacterium]